MGKMEESRKKESDSLKIKGYVTAYQGEGEDKRVIFERKPNKWVDAGLKGLLSFLLMDTLFSGYSGAYSIRTWANGYQIYLGDDTTTVTTHNLTSLISPIGSVPGTAPNNTSGEDRTNPATGEWKAAFTAIWNAGTVTGTVGEVALYLRPFTDITGRWSYTANTQFIYPIYMVSRISAGDEEISSFVIDTTKSLTVRWEVVISYE